MNDINFVELISQNLASIEVTETTKVTTKIKFKNSLFEEDSFSNNDWPLRIPLQNYSNESGKDFSDKINQQSTILKQQFKQTDPTSSFSIAIEYWKDQWNNVKYCFENKLPMLTIGNIQSQKTVYYLALTYLALKGFMKDDGTVEPELVDTVWLSTNNDKGSGTQNKKRANDTLIPLGINIFSVDLDDQKKDGGEPLQSGCYISISNKARNQLLIEYVTNTIKFKKEQCSSGFEYSEPRILVLLDEGDLSLVEMGGKELKKDSIKTEENLYNAVYSSDCLVRYMSISATMTSTIALYENFCDRLGELKTQQVFTPPISSFYKGLIKPDGSYNSDFLDETIFLKDEDSKYFSGGQYKSSANINNVINPNIIVAVMSNHYNQQQPLNGLRPTQIATVTLGKNKNQHTRTGQLIVDSFKKDGQLAELINSHDVTIDSKSEWVVITHNGDTNNFSAAEKLRKIYDEKHKHNVTLKGILFVGGHLLGRAVTYEIPSKMNNIPTNCHDTTSQYYGSYCNISFTLPAAGKPNIESLVQTFRCAGVRTDVKTHKVYTSKEISNSVKEYCNILSDIISLIRQKGSLARNQLIAYLSTIEKDDGKKITPVTTTPRKEKNISKAGGRVGFRFGDDIDQCMRDLYLQTGLPIPNGSYPLLAGDAYWKISKSEFDSILNHKNSKQIAQDFLKNKGINIEVSECRHAESFHMSASGETSAEDARRRAMYGNKTDNVVSLWQAPNKEYYFYVKYGQTETNYVIRYKIELESNSGIPLQLDRSGQKSIIPPVVTPNRYLQT